MVDRLTATSPAELEQLFTGPLGPAPAGVTDGTFLAFVDSRAGRDPRTRAAQTVLFRWPRWGIDFERGLWWFFDPRLVVGRFTMSAGRSRWRDAEVLRLEYGRSLSPLLRRVLYDELKPLPDGRILGMGGINAGPGTGDHFWFELRPHR